MIFVVEFLTDIIGVADGYCKLLMLVKGVVKFTTMTKYFGVDITRGDGNCVIDDCGDDYCW